VVYYLSIAFVTLHLSLRMCIRLQYISPLLLCALAMVLWYHTRLISESLPARFPAGRTEKHFLSPLPLLPHRLMSHFDVWRHLSFHENPHKTLQQQDNSSTRPRGEKEGATTTVYWRGAERGDQFYRAISKLSILV
jgi:hypothetical protein